MKNKIKVHILASSHPQFDEILDFPPEGVSYKIDRVKTKYHSWFTENKIRLHGILMNLLPIPRMTFTKTDDDTDLIHSTRGILQMKPKKPWIVDLECGDVFTSFHWKSMKNPIVIKIIMNALTSEKCKRILPQSNAAKKDLKRTLGEKNWKKIKDKTEVLYLAMRPYKKRIKRKNGKVRLSFIGIHGFYEKGTQDLLKAYEELTKKYKNIELRMKSDEFPKEYTKYKKLPGLKLITKYLPKEKLFEEMYLETDIFIFPTQKDHYGVVLLEAMSVGLPLIGTRSFTLPELIIDGKNGFLVDTKYSWENYLFYKKGRSIKSQNKKYAKDIEKIHPEIVKQLVEKISILIEDKKLREKMGKESRKMIESKNGKFSIKRRNKQLRKIYEEVLK